MSLRISLPNHQVPYNGEIFLFFYGANGFWLNLILVRYFVLGSNEKLEIYGTIEAGVIYPITFIDFMTRVNYFNITQLSVKVKQNTLK